MANFNFTVPFSVEQGIDTNVQTVVMNPTLLLEQNTLGGGTPILGSGKYTSLATAMRGVHVGGIVWHSRFVVLSPGGGGLSNYLIDFTTVMEVLYTQEVGSDGLPQQLPNFLDTWRPISVSDNPAVPIDSNGDIVKIHKRRSALLATGDNAYGFTEFAEALGAGSTLTSTDCMQGWGPSSLRLKRFIADNQQLVFHCALRTSTANTVNRAITWQCNGTLYYRLGWR